LVSAGAGLLAQAPVKEWPRPSKDAVMTIEDYDPKSSLVVPEHPKTRAKFPIIDFHNHQRGEMPAAQMEKLISDMDKINLQLMVNLSGGYGDRLKRNVTAMKAKYKDRFVVFANLTFEEVDAPDYSERVARQLEEDFKNGAQGLKFFKNFGMDLSDKSGVRVKIDDPRFDKAFEVCAKYKMPVMIHTAEPKSFFMPWDKNNERWLELKQFPSRYRPGDKYPGWEVLMGELYRRIERHPKVTFVNAHLGWLGADLGKLGELMDKMPNMMTESGAVLYDTGRPHRVPKQGGDKHMDGVVGGGRLWVWGGGDVGRVVGLLVRMRNMLTEIGAVLYDLGRQPRFAKKWFDKYQDRVLFGKDTWEVSEYNYYFRVLETDDEYFDYYRKRHAFWKMYGLDLSDEVLKKLYYKNALRIIPGIDASKFPK